MEPATSSFDEVDHQEPQSMNRKRSGDSLMESLHAKRVDRTDETSTALISMQGELESMFRQLISDEKLTINGLRFFGKIIKSCYLSASAVILLDPLWLNMSDNTSGLKPEGFDDAGQLAFPVYQNGHWTLCVAFLRHSEPKLINVYHYDSLQNEERFMAVCAHFRKWIEKSELDYNVIFKKAVCFSFLPFSALMLISSPGLHSSGGHHWYLCPLRTTQLPSVQSSH